MTRSIRTLISLAALLAAASSGLPAQTLGDYSAFYRMLRINAIEQMTPCYPTEAPTKEPVAYGVIRDSLGRVTQISRFSFGNPDTKGEWTTMRVGYTDYDTTNTVVQRRTFYNASGTPINIGWAFAEEVFTRKSNGQLLMRKLVDRSGNPVNDDVGVSRAMYRSEGPGMLMQEWYFKSGKLHFGEGSDGQLRPFADMPRQTYYRRMRVDSNGNLLREEVWGFEKKAIPFPGGEMVRAYELNDCGQPVRVTFLDLEERPMNDSNGIATMTMEYDQAGRIIAWRTFDASGDPKGRRGDDIAGGRYTYRTFDGVLLGEELFDSKGKPVLPPGEADRTNR